MNSLTRSFHSLAAALVAGAFTLLGLSANIPAAEKPSAEGKKGGHKAGPNAKSEAELLKDAYSILERADHDYKGHRHAAMHQIEEAATHLGVKLHGDGKGKEAQATSDEQVREARSMLEKAHGLVAGHKNAKVPEHINNAIKELGIALSIK